MHAEMRMEWLCKSAIIVAACVVLAGGEKLSFSSLFNATSPLRSEAQGVFMFKNHRLRGGFVYQFEAVFVRKNAIRFQIWRPSSPNQRTFWLQAEKRYVPKDEDIRQQPVKVRLEPSEYIEVLEGDRFAIYNENDTSAVGYSFDVSFTSTDPTYYIYRAQLGDNMVMGLGLELSFMDIAMPDKFAIAVHYETDRQLLPTFTQRPEVTPRSTLAPIPPSFGTLRYQGNVLSPHDNVLSTSARGIFILDGVRLEYGVVTSFYAHFGGREPVTFQIWRPLTQRDSYRLIGQLRVVPDNLGAQRIELGRGEYIFTEEGDRLGFMNEGSAGSIAYSFLGSLAGEEVLPYMSPLGERLPQAGTEVRVDTMELPYVFGVGVMYDTELDQNKYGPVPPDVTALPTLPSTTPTTTTSTIRPSTTPEQLQFQVNDMERVLSQGLYVTDRFIPQGANRSFLLKSLEFPVDGSITAFMAYFVNTGRVQFQIWRPTSDPDTFTLVGRQNFVPVNTPDFVGPRLMHSEHIPVQRGDVLGFVNEESRGSIGYNFEPVELCTSTANIGGALGRQQKFDVLVLPYQFVIAVSYIPVKGSVMSTTMSTKSFTTPTTTVKSPKPSLPKSTRVTTEATVTQNITKSQILSTQHTKLPPEGPDSSTTSLPSSEKPPKSPSTSDEPGWLSTLRDPWFMFGLLIWAALVSLLLIVLFIRWCCRLRKKRRNPYKYYSYRSSGVPSDYIGDIKDEDVLAFYNAAGIHGNNNNGIGDIGVNTNGNRNNNKTSNPNSMDVDVDNAIDVDNTSLYGGSQISQMQLVGDNMKTHL